MTHALAIARRDLAERTSVFIAAAVLAVLPFVLTVVPGMSSFNYMDVITTAGQNMRTRDVITSELLD